ncbi:MAG: YqaE/Pmp3 family membrane protein [Lentisphaeria bacterium]|nr:YqaE/Pmp3 family membrane protein [Lentisphaeria bacterium]
MTPSELIFRIILALLFPPLGIIGLPNVGCGTLLLLLLLTCLFFIPGQIVAIILIAQEYSRSQPG